MPNTTADNPVIKQIKKLLRYIAIATVILYIVVIGVAFKTYSDSAEVHDSLCTFRADLQQRVETTEGYLEEHPEGIAGVPAATLKTSISNQKQTILALNTLNC